MNEKVQTAYHHGNLREALISAGADMLAEEGLDTLSLRALARRLGVSHNAPYQHFADKDELLAAIAGQGFRLLTAAIEDRQGDERLQTAHDRLIAAGQSYVQFAVDHPHQFRLMFSPRSHSGYPELSAAARAAFDRLVWVVAEGQESGELVGDDPRPPAMLIWLAVHGLSTILIADKIPLDITGESEPTKLAAQYIELACRGLLAQR